MKQKKKKNQTLTHAQTSVRIPCVAFLTITDVTANNVGTVFHSGVTFVAVI